jgi:hypothetical protein
MNKTKALNFNFDQHKISDRIGRRNKTRQAS